MAKVPWFPFYVSDWLGSRKVLLMTDAQRGIYITLLAHQWSDTACSIPTDKAVLQKMLPGSKWKNIECVLRECFVVQGNAGERARNERLNVEQTRAIGKSEKAREAVKIRELLKLQRANDERTMIERSSNQIPQSQSQPEEPKSRSRAKKALAPFTPPTLEEVTAFCLERKNGIDPQKFIDHYTNTGWRIGKPPGYPMKDWKAAIRKTWEGKNAGLQKRSGERSGSKSFAEQEREQHEHAKRKAAELLGIRPRGSRTPGSLHATKDQRPGTAGALAGEIIEGATLEDVKVE